MPRYKSGTPSYTADTLPDPATLGVGVTVVVEKTQSTMQSNGSAFIGVLKV